MTLENRLETVALVFPPDQRQRATRADYRGAVAEPEVPMTGGNVSTGLVRVGKTVRRPAAPRAVDDFLRHLNDVGYVGAPRLLGRDGLGRQVVEYVEGEPADRRPALDLAGLARVGRLVRDLHDAAETFQPPDVTRLAAWVDGYRLDPARRDELVALLPRRVPAMHDLLLEGHREGRQPWCRLYQEGHADHWGPVAGYLEKSAPLFRAALHRR
jgi:hypothetical protein